ncbi:hypothetical protein vBBaMIFTN2_49 [Bordetella phage vB_BaM-IFTN2]|uniref:hypothetical protein n=1 Tax=Bordetella avium TaxID=521 RepID=UPI000E695E2C|nr:hypothetical protein [Bordetella avium]UOK17049.1 TerB family tellurite resistance protein [Bordetella phage vB_BaM-IFTN1]UOK17115.1 hypothetical protein vBBaMIFTN2_49 [Bordetella phage vB_BaM-IFTN2]UOK17177.1 TerB family tellurite resistance protein [Bordetella phage vB_BaM-IFTN3]UOK17383.1 TerB family tellurite resistance protein [Bordetella phage vB_BaM-IFTN6]UOK17448.1 TerB family tellurite resistance protein [Bordetella phage vB_BaM-IFTN7]
MGIKEKAPIYKRLGFWVIVGIVGFFVLPAALPRQEGETAGNTFFGFYVLALLALIVFYFINRKIQKKRLAKYLAAEADAVQQERIETLRLNGVQPVTADKALLASGESAYFSSLGTLYEMKTVSMRHGGAAVRVRVAKGVSVGMGGARSIPETQLVALSEGELVITNKRVLFAGRAKGFDAPISRIINVEYYADAVLMNLSGREKPYAVKIRPSEVPIFQETFTQVRAM